ncbi:MAG: PDZ domain-containing protein [bacterium]
MRPYPLLILLAVSVFAAALAPPAALADWRADLDRALAMEPGPDRDAHVKNIARAAPGWKDVRLHIEAMEFPEPEETRAILDSNTCIDGVTRPWVLYVSSNYDPSRPTPLLVRIHGGVGTPDIEGDPVEYVLEDPFIAGLEERGWLGAYPMGQAGATWWDDVGMANIASIVRAIKRTYNVDDDRVYMGGFSDGGSGSFAHAMLEPGDYAAFLCLNGDMGVGSQDGGKHLYAPNMMNTPIYATTTHDDGLYPTAKMAPSINMSIKAGADILFKSFPGEHEFEDIASDLGFMWEFLERHPRDPLPPRIVWEAAEAKHGQCRWFSIEKITTEHPARWHEDHNLAMLDDRITFGFMSDYDYEGEGVYVTRVLEGTAAEAVGLLADDIIVLGEDMRIGNLDDLYAYKEKLHRGGPFGLTVRRGEEHVILRGSLPEPENYLLFKREKPSARADVVLSGNHIWLRASRLGSLRVLVHPDMVNLDENIIITVNRKVVHEARVEPDLEFMIENFLKMRDRRLLYVAAIDVSLDKDKKEAAK